MLEVTKNKSFQFQSVLKTSPNLEKIKGIPKSKNYMSGVSRNVKVIRFIKYCLNFVKLDAPLGIIRRRTTKLVSFFCLFHYNNFIFINYSYRFGVFKIIAAIFFIRIFTVVSLPFLNKEISKTQERKKIVVLHGRGEALLRLGLLSSSTRTSTFLVPKTKIYIPSRSYPGKEVAVAVTKSLQQNNVPTILPAIRMSSPQNDIRRNILFRLQKLNNIPEKADKEYFLEIMKKSCDLALTHLETFETKEDFIRNLKNDPFMKNLPINKRMLFDKIFDHLKESLFQDNLEIKNTSVIYRLQNTIFDSICNIHNHILPRFVNALNQADPTDRNSLLIFAMFTSAKDAQTYELSSNQSRNIFSQRREKQNQFYSDIVEIMKKQGLFVESKENDSPSSSKKQMVRTLLRYVRIEKSKFEVSSSGMSFIHQEEIEKKIIAGFNAVSNQLRENPLRYPLKITLETLISISKNLYIKELNAIELSLKNFKMLLKDKSNEYIKRKIAQREQYSIDFEKAKNYLRYIKTFPYGILMLNNLLTRLEIIKRSNQDTAEMGKPQENNTQQFNEKNII